jgi:transcriptional regulator with XRE-family HTH domain
VDDRRVSRLFRAARLRKGWRQVDVELASGIDQTTVSLIERGRIARLTLETVRHASDVVGVRLELAPRMSAADVSSLLDEGHARLVDTVLGLLHRHGWETVAEYTFNHFGDRGSVDILAWHPATRTLVIVEVTTVLLDVQDLLGTLDRKCRVVPSLVSRERGWGEVAIGRLVVVEDRRRAAHGRGAWQGVRVGPARALATRARLAREARRALGRALVSLIYDWGSW